MGMTKGEMAAIYLRPAFTNENFSFEEAREYLALTDFGSKFVKNSWNSMAKKGIIILNEDGTAYFPENYGDDEEGNKGPINSAWTSIHRKHFICEKDNKKSGFGDFFTKEELEPLTDMYFDWKATCLKYQYYGFRRPNLPEPISEGLSSALFGWARTNNMPLENIEGSADLVDIIEGSAIQVKGISTRDEKDGGPTSFGPKSEFDRLIIQHVRLDEDKAYFYEIPNPQRYKEWKVNENQTIADQQAQGKRARINMIPILKELNLQPFFVYDFNESRT